MKCSYCKCKIVDRGFNIIPVCDKPLCKQRYNEDKRKVFEMFANIGGRTTRGTL